jgi:hypothetical protein
VCARDARLVVDLIDVADELDECGEHRRQHHCGRVDQHGVRLERVERHHLADRGGRRVEHLNRGADGHDLGWE